MSAVVLLRIENQIEALEKRQALELGRADRMIQGSDEHRLALTELGLMVEEIADLKARRRRILQTAARLERAS